MELFVISLNKQKTYLDEVLITVMKAPCDIQTLKGRNSTPSDIYNLLFLNPVFPNFFVEL